jgi:hypothetical protein
MPRNRRALASKCPIQGFIRSYPTLQTTECSIRERRGAGDASGIIGLTVFIESALPAVSRRRWSEVSQSFCGLGGIQRPMADYSRRATLFLELALWWGAIGNQHRAPRQAGRERSRGPAPTTTSCPVIRGNYTVQSFVIGAGVLTTRCGDAREVPDALNGTSCEKLHRRGS